MVPRLNSTACSALKDCSPAMPRKLDLSDRYARSGQRRNRRRVVTRPDEEAIREVAAPPAGDIAPATGGVAPARPAAPATRAVGRSRSTPVLSYHYIRSDLIRIGVVTGIILVLMTVLFFILR